MDLSEIKLVVTDMDGTLLNSRHEVSDRFFELHQQLRDRDILFVAASGRQYHSIVDKLAPIRDHILVIAENGGLVMQRDEELLSVPLPKGIKEKALQDIQGIEGACPVFCGKEAAYIASSQAGDFESILKEYYTSYKVLDQLEDHQGELLKIAIYHMKDAEKFIYPKMKEFEDRLKVKVSGEHWVDLSDNNAHKGHALEKIQEKYNISPAQTLVFGDYNNDLEMLALSDHSVAMANAHPNVVNASRYQTASNDDNGVEQVLEKLIRGV